MLLPSKGLLGLPLQPLLANDAKTCRGYFFIFGG
jgi:hypothetical protein